MSKKSITKRDVADSYRKAANLFEKEPHRRITGMFRDQTREKFCAVGAQCHFLKQAIDPTDPGFSHFLAYVNVKERFTVAGLLIENQHDLITLNDTSSVGTKDVVKALRKMASAVDHGALVSFPALEYPC